MGNGEHGGEPPVSEDGLSRRGFLGVGATAGVAMLCSVGGHQMSIANPSDVAKADAVASRLRRPRHSKLDAVDRLRFPTPQPQPGGQVREYWIAATSRRWTIAPGPDQWMHQPVPRHTSFTAFCYQEYGSGFSHALRPASMPGPTLRANVGDVLRIHFRNADRHFNQAVTMHPHGVKYDPDYDGAYYGDYTRAGGFISPGEEFVYTWEATPDSVGVWPYHDHGPNDGLNIARGLFGTVIVTPRGQPEPDVERNIYFHALPFPITNLTTDFQCINGRAFPGNTPTLRSKVGDEVAFNVLTLGSDFHTFHVHGHRWRKDGIGVFTDCPTLGPGETTVARFQEDNPGRWLYHCHVQAHMMMGMAGWYLVSP